MQTNEAVRRFYNDFSKNVLLEGYRHVSPRIEAIKSLCDQFIPPGAAVLEVGCGVGIISKHLQRSAASLLSVDISDTNVLVASAYARGPSAEFRVMDILVGEPGETFDAILLPDVIEHIPAENHEALLRKLESHLNPQGVLILTFPSPEYQQYHIDCRPEALQIVDEKVDPIELISRTSLKPLYLNYISIFGRNDYVHLALARTVEFSEGSSSGSIGFELRRKLRNVCWRLRNKLFLRRIRNVLREKH